MQISKDPTNLLCLAIKDCDQVAKISTYHAHLFHSYCNGGNAYLCLAEYKMKSGEDPVEELQLAIENYSKALKIKPDAALIYFNRVGAYVKFAQWLIRVKEDPTEKLQLALKDCAVALKLNPNDAGGFKQSWIGAFINCRMAYADR
jgi:tetratricopeptide (TPR) repeat protein